MNDRKIITDFLNCEYETFEGFQDGALIEKRFHELSARGKNEDFYPLIVVVTERLAERLGNYKTGFFDNPADFHMWRVIAAEETLQVDAQDFFRSRLEKYDLNSIAGEFLAAEPQNSLFSYMTNIDIPYPDIIIAMVPVGVPWELPLWIPMGGFDSCPEPYEQAIVFKYWYEKYGAVPAVITYDEWEFTVARPPSTDEDAEKLAIEHLAFCCNSVLKQPGGRKGIRGRASAVQNSGTWYFWWD